MEPSGFESRPAKEGYQPEGSLACRGRPWSRSVDSEPAGRVIERRSVRSSEKEISGSRISLGARRPSHEGSDAGDRLSLVLVGNEDTRHARDANAWLPRSPRASASSSEPSTDGEHNAHPQAPNPTAT